MEIMGKNFFQSFKWRVENIGGLSYGCIEVVAIILWIKGDFYSRKSNIG